LLSNDVVKVDGRLGVSRAFGNPDLKEYIISEPEISTYQIQPQDDLLILSTDGLYRVFSEQDVADRV